MDFKSNPIQTKGVGKIIFIVLSVFFSQVVLAWMPIPTLTQKRMSILAGIPGSDEGSGYSDGQGSAAHFNLPMGVAVDSNDNIYVADSSNYIIRKVTSAGYVTTFAGSYFNFGSLDGTGNLAKFNGSNALATDTSGNVYVAEGSSHTIRKITPSGVVTTLAGMAASSGTSNGTGSAARFNNPFGLAVDSGGNIYVSDSNSNTIRKVTQAGVVTTLAGLGGAQGSTDATGSAARFYRPRGIVVDGAGDLLVTDSFNHTIRKVTSAGVVTTVAGAVGVVGSTDATGTSARFSSPSGITMDSGGNAFITDNGNSTVRKMTSAGVVTTFAGSADEVGDRDGTGSAARFYSPFHIAIDSQDNLYVAGYYNNSIRKITSAGVVTTLAGTTGASGVSDGTSSAARFSAPAGVAMDSNGDIYSTDYSGHSIRKVTAAGVVTTLAGRPKTSGSADGTGVSARFNQPHALAINSSGDIYVADTFNHTIRKVTSAGVVTTLAGLAGASGSTNATGSAARFNTPYGIAVNSSGDIFVADTNNRTIRKVTPGGVVTLHAGAAGLTGSSDGTGGSARFSFPQGIAVDSSGVIWVADTSNHTIRRLTAAGVVTTFSGSAGSAALSDGTSTAARFNTPVGISTNSSGDLFVTESVNHTIRKVDSTGAVTTLAGSGGSGYSNATGTAAQFNSPRGVVFDGSANLYVGDFGNNAVRKITSSGVVTTLAGYENKFVGSKDGLRSVARFNGPSGIAVNTSGEIYVADVQNHLIRKIALNGIVSTVAGSPGVAGAVDGTSGAARFNGPFSVAVDSNDNVYVASSQNHAIRKITPAGVVTTLAGAMGFSGSSDGTGSAARFNSPVGIAIDTVGDLYVSESSNHTIRKVTAAGVVTTLAGAAGALGSSDGTGSAARFNLPYSLAVDSGGDVYVADGGNNVIRKVTPSGVVTTFAGSAASAGSTDGTGSAARFYTPRGISIDSAGNFYVADFRNSAIRKITPAGVVTTIVGADQSPQTVPGALPAYIYRPIGIVTYGGRLYISTQNSIVGMPNP